MNETVTPSPFLGYLKRGTPLRDVFISGMVPLSSAVSAPAKLGAGESARVFFIVVASCTTKQKEGMAQLMHRMGQGSLDETRAAVAAAETLPVREHNFNGVDVRPTN